MNRIIIKSFIAIAISMLIGLSQYQIIDLSSNTACESYVSANTPIPSKVTCSTSGRGHNWSIETVDSAGKIEFHIDIAVDSNNKPHISYHDGWPNDNLKYAYWNGNQWEIETVDSNGLVGYNLSIALDSNDEAHISYSDLTNYDLKYAYFNGTDWSNETIDSDGWVGGHTSIAVDSHDRPHISYHKLGTEGNIDEQLKYAYYDGDAWHNETVDSQGDVGWETSIALDNNDRPHISYYDATNDDLKYAYFNGEVWSNVTVDSQGGSRGEGTSIALDSNGLPHIGYYIGWPNTNLKYAYYNGTAWFNETVESQGDVGWCPSIAVDNNDRVHMCYGSNDPRSLEYAHHDGMRWGIETVDADGSPGVSSMGLDNNNTPHIGYINNGVLKYATRGITDTGATADAGPDQTIDRGNVVTFDGSGSSGENEIVNYTWTLNDLGLIELFGVAPTYRFNNIGIFYVTLNVTDAEGQWDMDTTTITVNDTSPPSPPILRPTTNRTKFEQLLLEGSAPQDCSVKVVVNDLRAYNCTPDPEHGGNFSMAVLLDPGENVLTAYAIDRFNRSSPAATPHLIVLDQEAPYVTDIYPERNRTEVPIDTEIRIDFNEPLSSVTVILYHYNEVEREWERVEGNTQYRPWTLFANFIPSGLLLKETRHRMEIEMEDMARKDEGDTAGNTVRAYLYSRSDWESYTFITESKEHDLKETQYVIKSQVINITYTKLGKEPLSRPELLKPLEEPASPPDGNLSLGIYFSVTFQESVKYAKVALRYYLNAQQLKPKLRDPELWDIGNISFYMLSNGTWEKLDTMKLFEENTIWFYVHNPGNVTFTLGIFAPDLDWDDDGVPNSKDTLPEDPDNYADSDGDGVIDSNDPFPNDPLYKADTDNDGAPDSWERLYDLSPTDPSDGDGDEDNDGLSNAEEFERGTSPNDPDSDGDGMPDGWEVDYDLDPRDASDKDLDADNDGLTNYEEYEKGRDPFVADPPSERGDRSTGGRTVFWLVLGVILGLLIIGIIVFVAVWANRGNRGLEGEEADMDISEKDEFGRV